MARIKGETIEATGTPDALEPKFVSGVQCATMPDHFLLQFLYHAPPDQAIILGRLAMTPPLTKRLRDLLARQVRMYERAHGKIDETLGDIKGPRAKVKKRAKKATARRTKRSTTKTARKRR